MAPRRTKHGRCLELVNGGRGRPAPAAQIPGRCSGESIRDRAAQMGLYETCFGATQTNNVVALAYMREGSMKGLHYGWGRFHTSEARRAA